MSSLERLRTPADTQSLEDVAFLRRVLANHAAGQKRLAHGLTRDGAQRRS